MGRRVGALSLLVRELLDGDAVLPRRNLLKAVANRYRLAVLFEVVTDVPPSLSPRGRPGGSDGPGAPSLRSESQVLGHEVGHPVGDLRVDPRHVLAAV